MTPQDIEQLKEYKKLYDEGILTQDEFDSAKRKILDAGESLAVVSHGQVMNNPVQEATVDQQETYYSYCPNKTIPWHQRSTVMDASSVNDLVGVYHNRKIYSIVLAAAGTILLGLFVSKCIAGGFWAIFFSVFWALLPGIPMFIGGLLGFSLNGRYEHVFKNSTDEELYFLKEYISGRRAYERQVAGQVLKSSVQAAKRASEVYEQMTGRNAARDMGGFIGNLFS